MKRKLLFLVVAIIGILATVSLEAATSYGSCANSGWGCKTFCPDCGTWFRGTSGRSGPGILTKCGICGYTRDITPSDEESEEGLELD